MSNEKPVEVVQQKPLNEAQKLLAGIYATGDTEKQQNWSDIEGFYCTLMAALVSANSETINMLRIPGILSHIQDKAAAKLAIDGLDSDIQQFAKELNGIHDLHKDKSGPIDSPDDLTKCFSIFELYMAFQTRYHSVIMPTVELIAELCTTAAKAISAEAEATAQEQLQDPSVISDIEVKENTTETIRGEL